MKLIKLMTLIGALAILSATTVAAREVQIYRQQSDVQKMMHKFGRGVTNVLTCWVEWPRNVAIEWEKTDPATGAVLGTVKGVGWTAARLVSGAYEIVSFPFPVPEDYAAMMEPEFVVTDVWGDPIPTLTEFGETDPYRPMDAPFYPERFNF